MPLVQPQQYITSDPHSDVERAKLIRKYSNVYAHQANTIIDPDNAFELQILDSESIRIGPGKCIKDNIVIDITEEFDLNLAQDYYIDEVQGMVDTGYYYIVIHYNHARTLPAPKAYYKMIRDDSLYLNYQNRYMYLGSVYVKWNHLSSNFEIDSLTPIEQFHPENDQVKRTEMRDVAFMLDCGELQTPVIELGTGAVTTESGTESLTTEGGSAIDTEAIDILPV